jgi:hypothetical protein
MFYYVHPAVRCRYAVVSAPSGPVSLNAVRDMLATTKRANRTFPSSQLLADAAPLVAYSVNVTNTGTMDADDAVLGFLVPPGAGVDGVPLQQLYAFNRVHVLAGKTVTVELCVTRTTHARAWHSYPPLCDGSLMMGIIVCHQMTPD